MGAINYGNNKIINLGVNVNSVNEYMEEYIKNENIDYYGALEEVVYDEMCYLYEKCEEIINNLGYLEFYEITLKSGYYEGFYLDIKNNVCYYENFKEKLLAQKELTRVKKALKEIILNYNIVVYTSGWSTSYENKDNTLILLNLAIKKERELIKDTLTDKRINFEMWKNGIFTKTKMKEVL